MKNYRSELQTNQQTGRQSLTVWYSQKDDDFEDAIAAGLKRFGLENVSLPILAVPEELDNCH